MAPRPSLTLSSVLRQLRPRAQRTAPLRSLLNLPARTAFQPPVFIRAAHAIPRPPRSEPSQSKPESQDEYSGELKGEGARPEPKSGYYQITFTCVPCGYRSHHNVSKQGYHKGSTLIACPSCRNRHVISDHLNIFGDRKITVEDLMKEKGQLVKRGTLGEDGDIEFWPDETYSEQEEGTGKSDNS